MGFGTVYPFFVSWLASWPVKAAAMAGPDEPSAEDPGLMGPRDGLAAGEPFHKEAVEPLCGMGVGADADVRAL